MDLVLDLVDMLGGKGELNLGFGGGFWGNGGDGVKNTSFSDHFERGGSWLPTMVANFMDFFGIFWIQEIGGNAH